MKLPAKSVLEWAKSVWLICSHRPKMQHIHQIFFAKRRLWRRLFRRCRKCWKCVQVELDFSWKADLWKVVERYFIEFLLELSESGIEVEDLIPKEVGAVVDVRCIIKRRCYLELHITTKSPTHLYSKLTGGSKQKGGREWTQKSQKF